MTENPNAVNEASRVRALDGFLQDELVDAACRLLEVIHDIDFHYSPDSFIWELDSGGVHRMAGLILSLAARVAHSSESAQTEIAGALARHEWQVSGKPMRCGRCGTDIDPSLGEWQVARGWADHGWCQEGTDADADADHAIQIEEDEYEAYCVERARTGLHIGDQVEVTYPDGHKVKQLDRYL